MKIMLAHSRYRSAAPSGENLVVEQEAAALVAAGHDVEIFERCSDDIGDLGILARAAIPARITRSRPVRVALRERLKHSRPDVVHVHNTFPLLSPSVLLAARDARVPVVATLHNYKLLCASGDFFRSGNICHECAGGSLIPGLTHGCYRGSRVATVPVSTGLAVNRHVWRDVVAAYVFISDAQRGLMQALRLPEGRVFVKHNFVHKPSNISLAERRHGVSYVGRLDEAKGTPQLMAAWDLFRSRCPTSALTLTIAGHGPLAEEVASWASGHATVDYQGLVNRDEARTLVSGGLAALVPSAWEETFGLVAVEAMAAGVAPIAPATGSFPELISDGVDGALFAAGAPGLAAVLQDVDADPVRFLAVGAAAESTYRDRFEPKANLDQLLEIYSFAISNPRSPR